MLTRNGRMRNDNVALGRPADGENTCVRQPNVLRLRPSEHNEPAFLVGFAPEAHRLVFFNHLSVRLRPAGGSGGVDLMPRLALRVRLGTDGSLRLRPWGSRADRHQRSRWSLARCNKTGRAFHATRPVLLATCRRFQPIERHPTDAHFARGSRDVAVNELHRAGGFLEVAFTVV